jgi:hypothetical protein
MSKEIDVTTSPPAVRVEGRVYPELLIVLRAETPLFV